MNFYGGKSSAAEERVHRFSLLGTGNGTVPTATFAQGCTITWIATGRLLFTWADNPGVFLGLGGQGFRDATQANVKGFTATAGVFPNTASTYTLEVDIWNASQTAVDLQTTNNLDLEIVFKATSA